MGNEDPTPCIVKSVLHHHGAALLWYKTRFTLTLWGIRTALPMTSVDILSCAGEVIRREGGGKGGVGEGAGAGQDQGTQPWTRYAVCGLLRCAGVLRHMLIQG